MTINQGDTVPDFELPDETGTPRTLSGLLETCLELTGSHIERDDDDTRRPTDDHHRRRRPHQPRTTSCGPGRPGSSTTSASIAGRALRGVPRDIEAVIPPVFIAIFFFVVNVATLSKLTQAAGPGLRLRGVPDAHRDPARGHRRLARAGAGARRAERVPRSAAHDADPAAGRSCSATWSPTWPWPSGSPSRSSITRLRHRYALTVPTMLEGAPHRSIMADVLRPARRTKRG